MKKRYLPFFIIFITFRSFATDDPINKVAGIIRQGNMHELSTLMAESVDVVIQGNENTYLKAQAEVVLNNFFSQNRPLSVKVLHKINSNPHYQFGVLLMDSGKGAYRIAFTLKEISGKLQLIELRIETEKVR
jgi:hypothetical protein